MSSALAAANACVTRQAGSLSEHAAELAAAQSGARRAQDEVVALRQRCGELERRALAAEGAGATARAAVERAVSARACCCVYVYACMRARALV